MLYLNIPKYSHGDILKWKSSNIIIVHISIKKNVPSFSISSTNFKERSDIIQKMIKDTLEIYTVNDVELIINISDIPSDNPFFLHYSSTKNCNINVIPNFSLYTYSDAKSADFFETKKQILDNSVDWINKENKIMWSGQKSSSIREKMNIFKNHKDYFYNLITISNKRFINLQDHSKYKYLLDMEGMGYSGRFPYLALTGSCVIILDNTKHKYRYYYDEHFQENIHYLRVEYTDNDDVNEINDRIHQKIQSVDAKEIGKKCQSIAIDVFTKSNILLYFKELLNHYSASYDPSNIQLNKEIPYSKINMNKIKLFHLLSKKWDK